MIEAIQQHRPQLKWRTTHPFPIPLSPHPAQCPPDLGTHHSPQLATTDRPHTTHLFSSTHTPHNQPSMPTPLSTHNTLQSPLPTLHSRLSILHSLLPNSHSPLPTQYSLSTPPPLHLHFPIPTPQFPIPTLHSQHSPHTTLYSLLPNPHYPLPTSLHSPLSSIHSPLSTFYYPLSIPYSLLPTPQSPLPSPPFHVGGKSPLQFISPFPLSPFSFSFSGSNE